MSRPDYRHFYNYDDTKKEFDFSTENESTLTITPPDSEDENWKDEEFSLALLSTKNVDTGSVFRGMVIDDDVAPIAEFSKSSIKLTEDSST